MKEAVEICEQLKAKPKLTVAHLQYYEYYKMTGAPWKALEHMEISHSIRATVSGEQMQNKIKQLQTTFATEKADKEKEIERLRNFELKQAYEQIEQKNKDILDSINYAKKIQFAILPSEEEIRRLLPNSFFLYMPKEVVSGDFYWCVEKGDHVFVAAVDCTGHGVPGAFMSMIGNILLNEIVVGQGIQSPAEILNELRAGIIKSLRQKGMEGENRDGMDIALYRLTVKDKSKLSLCYAGANNPLWHFREGKLTEIAPDKQPIGVHHGTQKPFRETELDLKKGDTFYIFTDGFADQFGGEDMGKKGGKKFKYSRLKDQLVSHQGSSMREQEVMLQTTFEKCRGDLEQTDDELVIGVRI